jgi:hypothetical protein
VAATDRSVSPSFAAPTKEHAMTTQKLFKRRVRERMAKTGERYATARHHLTNRQPHAEPPSATGLPLASPDATRPVEPDLLALAHDMASEASLRAATGQGWVHWIAVLDRWGATERTHTVTAAHLQAEHAVPGWWAQTITGGYERARGLRRKHEQAHGFTVYASKTIGVSVEELFDAFADEATRRGWLRDGELTPRSAQRPKVARFDWDGGPTRIMVTFDAKGPIKTTASVAHERLPDPDAAEEAKAAWRGRLIELKAVLEAGR